MSNLFLLYNVFAAIHKQAFQTHFHIWKCIDWDWNFTKKKELMGGKPLSIAKMDTTIIDNLSSWQQSLFHSHICLPLRLCKGIVSGLWKMVEIPTGQVIP